MVWPLSRDTCPGPGASNHGCLGCTEGTHREGTDVSSSVKDQDPAEHVCMCVCV